MSNAFDFKALRRFPDLEADNLVAVDATDRLVLAEAGPFYYAEDYHQQYLAKVPNGYCGLGGTGVACPVGLKTGS